MTRTTFVRLPSIPAAFLFTLVAASLPAAADDEQTGLAQRVEALEAQLAEALAAIGSGETEISNLQSTVTDLQEDVLELQETVEAQATTIAEQGDVIEELEFKLTPVSVSIETIEGLAGPHWILTGVNLHVRNGLEGTDTANGLGNLLVGYNEFSSSSAPRVGSHNLVVGPKHGYSSYGGLVAGAENDVTGASASVTGGERNFASGTASSVIGGGFNRATGNEAVVSGGAGNEASGFFASVTGGSANEASGDGSSVSGGREGTAPGIHDWVAGSLFEDE